MSAQQGGVAIVKPPNGCAVERRTSTTTHVSDRQALSASKQPNDYCSRGNFYYSGAQPIDQPPGAKTRCVVKGADPEPSTYLDAVESTENPSLHDSCISINSTTPLYQTQTGCSTFFFGSVLSD
jgi:hypothetical protein